MSNLIQQRLAALRAAKAGATDGNQRDNLRQESGAGEQSSARVSPEGHNTSKPAEPARADDVQHESLDVVVLSDQLQPTTMLVVEQPADADETSEPAGDSTDLDRSNPIHFQFLTKLQELETALLARDPQMKTHLAAIHKTMIQYDDIPNLLRPQEIAKIMSAQQVHTNTTLAQTVAKKSSTKKSVTANLTLDDV